MSGPDESTEPPVEPVEQIEPPVETVEQIEPPAEPVEQIEPVVEPVAQVEQPEPGEELDPATGLPQIPWRRLSPRMLLVHPVHSLIRFLPALVVIFLARRSSSDSGGQLVELGATVLVVLVGLLHYFTTRFRIWNGQIELRSGLFVRQRLATPADRVRTVDLTSTPYHRILGLSKVVIGTAASGHGAEKIELNALPTAEARTLRDELIHVRSLAAGAALAATPAPGSPGSPAQPGRGRILDAVLADLTGGTAAGIELVRLDPRWVRYAPLTTAGLLSALTIVGFGSQLIRGMSDQFWSQVVDVGQSAASSLGWLVALVVAVGGLTVVAVLAIAGYLLQFWGFRLTRHAGGTLHVSRGLLTTREVSIEEKRLRGVDIGEHLGLRLVGGARLSAIATGLGRADDSGPRSVLVPPAPRSVVLGVADRILGDATALTGPLIGHPIAARRRRVIRATVFPAVLALGAALWAGFGDLPWWPTWVLVGFAALGAPLGLDRYAGLGHLVTPEHLVTRSGTFGRSRAALERDGIIGWVERETFFQRRAGLVSMVATTAAGAKGYVVHDCSGQQALAVMAEINPALIAQFAGDSAPIEQ